MARIKVTEDNIRQRLIQWAQGQNTLDELIFIDGSIQISEWVNQAWVLANMIIEVKQDTAGFSKFIYKEKL